MTFVLQDRGSPSPSSVASSPERCFHGPPAARNISRGYTNGNIRGPKDPAAGKAAVGGTYMEELKTLLREISSENPSPFSRKHATSSRVTTRKVERDIKPGHNVQDIVKKTELLCSMNKNGAVRAKPKAAFEADFVSSTSISANSSRACSVTSRRDKRETRVVMVENGKADGMVSTNGQFDHGDRFHGNGNANVKDERQRDPVVNRTFEVRDVRETKTYERRNAPQENGFREDNGVRRVLEKRLVQSRWTQQQAAEFSSRSVQERLEKRTVEVRGCAPQVIQSGHQVIREQLVKEVLENGLPSPEKNGHGSFRKIAVTPIRDRNNHNDTNGKVTPVKQRKDAQESYAPQQVLPNGKPAANEIASVRPRGPAAHAAAGNGHKMISEDLRRRPMQQMEDHTREYALLNGTEKLRNRQPG